MGHSTKSRSFHALVSRDTVNTTHCNTCKSPQHKLSLPSILYRHTARTEALFRYYLHPRSTYLLLQLCSSNSPHQYSYKSP